MAEINLLRSFLTEKSEKSRRRTTYNIYITFIVFILLAIAVFIFWSRFYLSSQNNNLSKEIAGLEEKTKKAQEIKDQTRIFNNIMSQTSSLEKKEIPWKGVYEKIAESTPANIQLVKVSSVGATSKTKTATTSNKLKITGITKTRRDIALFQEKLQKNSEKFADVEIVSSKESSTAGQTSIDFEIEISLK